MERGTRKQPKAGIGCQSEFYHFDPTIDMNSNDKVSAYGPPVAFGEYTIHQALPSPAEHFHLRSSAGLTTTPIDPAGPQYLKALQTSPYALVARTQTGDAVGMVRLIGDGLLVLQICDMAILPAHQRRGLGAELLRILNKWCDDNAPFAWVSLIGDPPGQALYRKMDFVPTEGLGMRRKGWGSWLPGNPFAQDREKGSR